MDWFVTEQYLNPGVKTFLQHLSAALFRYC